MASETRKAVILARGLGSRMRKADANAALNAAQAAVADSGIKAMVPIGRPFLDYTLHQLAEAGCNDICLVIGPEHEAVRQYYTGIKAQRLKIHFAIQEKPLGTADAVLAAQDFAVGEHFLVLNSDNFYPVDALRSLRQLHTAGVAVFEREALIAGGIPAERIEKFAIIETALNNHLKRIIEKPDPATIAAMGKPLYVSLNCWRFAPSIFHSCRQIAPSPRGEFEIPDAVAHNIQSGEPFTVLKFTDPVLDLSSREDIPRVAARLHGMEVNL